MPILVVRPARLIVLLLVPMIVLLAACSSSSSGEPATGRPATATATGPTVWDNVLKGVTADGHSSLATALSAFTVAVAPLPGATVPPGARGDIGSGTLAVDWVLAHWRELDDAQRTAVLRALAPGGAKTQPVSYLVRDAGRAAAAPAAQNPELACLRADSTGAAKYRDWLPGIESAVAAKLGRPLGVSATTFLSVNAHNLEGDALMYAWGCNDKDATSNAISGCTVHINPRAVGGTYTDDMVRTFLIHEITHCFLLDKFGFAYGFMPAWYLEGAPTWTMSVLGTANDRLSAKWLDYLDSPTRPLSRRSYDAVGFFAHLAETGTDPWSVIDPIGTALARDGSTPSGWNAAGVTPAFTSSWGPGYVRGRYPGQPWTTSGPNLPAYTPALPNASVGDGGTSSLGSVAFAVGVQRIDIDATVLLVSAGAGTSGQLSTGSGASTPLTAGGPYCSLATCACPSESPGAGTTFTHIDRGQQYLGLSGGNKAGSVVLTGMSLDSYCRKPPVPCLVGHWTTVAFDARSGPTHEHGGAGADLRIDAKGKVTVVFDGMSPVEFTSSVGGAAGSFVYAGGVNGVITLPKAGTVTGRWGPASPANYHGLTATGQLTSPVHVDFGPIDVVDLAGRAGKATGGAVSNRPLVTGSWRCSGDTLVSAAPPSSAITGTWTLRRVK